MAQRPFLPVIAGLTFVGVSALGAAVYARDPLFLWNGTPSEPEGFYVRTDEGPAKGRLVAFRVPEAAFPYADRHLRYLHAIPALKELAAGPGDRVCIKGGALSINGQRRGAIIRFDRDGRPLPVWNACRALAADEFFAFSNRVPNSFDSRYFGPVKRSRIVAAYRPILPFGAFPKAGL